MTVSFDPDRGQLCLDDGAFAVLRDLVRQVGTEQADPYRLAELRNSGVLQGGIPHPSLAYGLDAVAAPVCWWTLRVERLEQTGRHWCRVDGWVGRDAMAALRDAGDGMRQFQTVPVALLPDLLAGEVDLGPRPRPPELSISLPGEAVEAVLSSGGAAREQAMVRCVDAAAEAGPAAAAAARAMVNSVRRRWQVSLGWQPADGAAGERSLQVVDSEVGLWRVTSATGAVTFSATTPTVVWQEIIDLLPRDDELRLAEPESAWAGPARAGGGLESWQGDWSGSR